MTGLLAEQCQAVAEAAIEQWVRDGFAWFEGAKVRDFVPDFVQRSAAQRVRLLHPGAETMP